MLEINTGESSKASKNEKSETEQYRTMYKYALIKRYHHDRRCQFYMYAFIYLYQARA